MSTRNELMIGLLVVTHGPLAQDLVSATQRIVGETPRIEAIALAWDEEQAQARRRIEEAIHRNEQGQGILILTDLFGGTASNLSFAFRQAGKVDVVTGVNLPMVIKFTNLRGIDRLEEVAAKIRDEGRKAIYAASEVLKKDADKGAA
jgi:PTS system mannose-specific IIA component